LKPLFQNVNELTKKLRKSAGSPKAGIPSNLLDNAASSDFGAPGGKRHASEEVGNGRVGIGHRTPSQRLKLKLDLMQA
jgi:hypothetical protein